jgi:hypothetical protein
MAVALVSSAGGGGDIVEQAKRARRTAANSTRLPARPAVGIVSLTDLVPMGLFLSNGLIFSDSHVLCFFFWHK